MPRDVMKKNKNASLITNCIIVILTLIGSYLCFFVKKSNKGLLHVEGIENLKFFTVQSNILAGIAALISAVCIVNKKDSKTVAVLKYVATAAVGLTFLTIAAFLGPLYGHSHMYHGANLYFHLIIPLFAMVEFVLLNDHKMGIKENLYTMIPPFLYGTGYLINILINGAEGNDFYAFTAWGLSIGIVIFAGIVAVTFLLGFILRKLNNHFRKSPQQAAPKSSNLTQ